MCCCCFYIYESTWEGELVGKNFTLSTKAEENLVKGKLKKIYIYKECVWICEWEKVYCNGIKGSFAG